MNNDDNTYNLDEDDARRLPIVVVEAMYNDIEADGLNYDNLAIWEQVVLAAENKLANMSTIVDDPEAIGVPQLSSGLSRIMVGPCFSSTEKFKSVLHDEIIKSNYEYKQTDTKKKIFLAKCVNRQCTWSEICWGSYMWFI